MTSKEIYLAMDTVSDDVLLGIYQGSRPLYATTVSTPRALLGELGDFMSLALNGEMAPRSSVEKICVAVGPGSFTGSRIGVASAKSLALALNVKVVCFDHQEALMHRIIYASHGRAASSSIRDEKWLVIVSNAKRGQAHLLFCEVSKFGPDLLLSQSLTQDIAEVVVKINSLGPSVYIVGDLASQITAQLEHRQTVVIGSREMGKLDPDAFGKYLVDLMGLKAWVTAQDVSVRYSREYEPKSKIVKISPLSSA